MHLITTRPENWDATHTQANVWLFCHPGVTVTGMTEFFVSYQRDMDFVRIGSSWLLGIITDFGAFVKKIQCLDGFCPIKWWVLRGAGWLTLEEHRSEDCPRREALWVPSQFDHSGMGSPIWPQFVLTRGNSPKRHLNRLSTGPLGGVSGSHGQVISWCGMPSH